MKVWLVLLWIILPCVIAGQDYTINVEKDSLLFTLKSKGYLLIQEDSLPIHITITNNSHKTYFLIDIELIPEDVEPFSVMNRIDHNIMGYLYDGPPMLNRLQKFEPGDKVNFDLYFKSKYLDKKVPQFYLISAEIGYFEYDKDFEYLTQIENTFQGVDPDLMLKAIFAHNLVSLGYLPVVVTDKTPR